MTVRTGVIIGLVCLLLSGGCVERTMKIQTDPSNALVIVNDEEVGLSPVKFSFLWYGDYDIIVRKAGYETLKTHHRLDPPWYQFPPIDFVVETLMPGTIRDEREVPLLTLESTRERTDQEIVGRAEETRDRALFGGGEP
ncbi:MAG: hypothetical protein CHACPFDD_01036 [Phycisphaerae bacterium]|nr:hypothetical protein [Phycisphaerae bacterium]